MKTTKFVLCMAAMVLPLPAGVISLTNNTTGLFDNSSGNRLVTVTGVEPGFGTGVITDVNITINFAKADGEGFSPPFPLGTPFFNEIVLTLTGPGGQVVNLISENSFNTGSAGTLFDGTITFDDAAGSVVNVNPNLPTPGTFRPVGTLASYNTLGALGSWTLFIEDTVGADALRFRSFTINITTSDVPEPSTYGMLALGSALLAAGRRKYRSTK